MVVAAPSVCPEDFPDEHRTAICKDVFSGLAYLHGRGILHRDIKLANIFVRFGKVMRAVIGDVGLGTMMTSSLAAGEAHTAHVCSDGYVPPELLQVRSNCNDSAVYGSAVDVWSAGVVTFEVATMSVLFGSRSYDTGGHCPVHRPISAGVW